MISLFVIFVCEDRKELLCCIYGAIFQFYEQKSPEDMEDADVSDICGPARPHPVRCLPSSSAVGHHEWSRTHLRFGTVRVSGM